MIQIPTFKSLFPKAQLVEIIDIGSNPIQNTESPPNYNVLLRNGQARVTGFEPGTEAFAALQKLKSAHERYFPYAIGDGTTQTFYECKNSFMSSLYEPNQEILKHLHQLDDAAQVIATHEMATHRLDDISEITIGHYIHMDVQGAELQCLQGAEKLLENVLVIQAETNFVSMYKNQPLFSEVEYFLRQRGFMLHKLHNPQSRTLKPLCLNGKIFEGWSQLFWCDSVFIRDIQSWPTMQPDQLLQLAHIMHEMFFSFDIVLAILMERDHMLGTRDTMVYIQMLSQYVPQLVKTPQG
jgi:FkbM family methyltransferase